MHMLLAAFRVYDHALIRFILRNCNSYIQMFDIGLMYDTLQSFKYCALTANAIKITIYLWNYLYNIKLVTITISYSTILIQTKFCI